MPSAMPIVKQIARSAGQDCIPEVLDEMRSGKSAIIGSISHGAETYGRRLVELGISLLRGNSVPSYNYVHQSVVMPETLSTKAAGVGKA
jgi:ribose transport system substrate-binding protein